MSESYDATTGEVRGNGHLHPPPMPLPPPANRNINDAIELALRKLGVQWIQATKDSGRGTAKYATLKDILAKVQPILLEHRVRIRQGTDRSWPCDEGGGSKGRLIPVYTDLIHCVSGEVERTMVEMPLTRLDPQAMGSAITYGKRYSLLAALGLATDEADDDGERAMPRDVSEPVKESAAVIAIKGEIDKIKDASALAEWGLKNKPRIQKLSDDESTIIRLHYQAHGRKIRGE